MKVTTKSSRARGQALLFAVLLMVFAALLGATFVTVVSLNLNQTDRSVARTDAATAAQAGLKFANDRIVTGSLDGDPWLPEKIAPPPARDELSYNEYYTPFEKAQGWQMPEGFTYGSLTDPIDRWRALQTYKASNPLARFFVKFPDPRSKETTGPVSLIEVSTVQAGDKAGMLRLEVIGRSEDNDTAFARVVAYKPTAAATTKTGVWSYARFDSNYDWSKNKPLVAHTVLNASSGASSFAVDSVANFAPGIPVVVVQGTTSEFGVVAAVNSASSPNTITLKAGTANAFSAGADIRAASVLADGLTSSASLFPPSDFDADGLSSTITNNTTLAPVRNAATSSGLYFNNGLYVGQKIGITLASTGALKVSGPALNDGSLGANKTINGNQFPAAQTFLKQNVAAESPPALDYRLNLYRSKAIGSDAPTVAQTLGYGDGVYIANNDDVEQVVVASKLKALSNADLMRLWQRKPLADASIPAANNKLYFPPAETPTLWNYPDPVAPTIATPTTSLEQRGVRGWISPWEYVPRGVFIELQGDQITITRDDRSDFAPGIDENKAWRNSDGTLSPAGPAYRMVINTLNGDRQIQTPGSSVIAGKFNGVIFAEGNVRVRGYLGARSITIASMGTIYAEGNIIRDATSAATLDAPSIGAARIALVAKRNVVVNPSAFLGRRADWQTSDVQTMLNTVPLAESVGATSTVTGDTSAHTADLALLVRVGDSVRIADTVAQVTSVSPTTGLALSATIPVPSSGSAVPSGTTVSLIAADPQVQAGKTLATSITDPATNGTFKYGTDEYFYQLGDASRTFQRLAKFDRPASLTVADKLWLDYQHGAQMRRAFTLKYTNYILPLPKTASVKTATGGAQPKILDTDKKLDLNPENPDLHGETITQFLTHFPYEDAVPSYSWSYADETGPASLPAVGLVPARRLAQATKSVASGGFFPLALTTSRQLLWNNGSMTLTSNFGSASVNSPTDPENDAEGEGVNESFYWRIAGNERSQTSLRVTSRILTDAATAPASGSQNTVALSMDEGGALPGYRIAAPRLSTVDLINAAAGPYTPLKIRIQATIFAREGSFYVLPAPMTIKPQLSTLTEPYKGDLNGDGTGGLLAPDDKDASAATLFRRPNYQIVIAGTVVQNFSVPLTDYDTTADADGQAVGPAFKSLDASSYPTQINNGLLTGTSGDNWNTVQYVSDPVGGTGTGLFLPFTPDLLYVG